MGGRGRGWGGACALVLDMPHIYLTNKNIGISSIGPRRATHPDLGGGSENPTYYRATCGSKEYDLRDTNGMDPTWSSSFPPNR